MKCLIAFATLLPLITAMPAIVRRRALPTHQIHQRQNTANTTCPRYLTPGNYENPSLIVPISAANPTKAFGSSTAGIFTPGDVSSIFNFDVPESRTGQNCTLEFIFPYTYQLGNGSTYLFDGPGTFRFTGYNPGDGALWNTTFDSQPAPGPYPPFPPVYMQPGNAYTIDIGPCIAGTVVAGLTGSNDTTLIFEENDGSAGGCPIGVFVAYSG